MEKVTESSVRRVYFNETGTKLLLDCIASRENVLNNKKTNGTTPAIKKKVE